MTDHFQIDKEEQQAGELEPILDPHAASSSTWAERLSNALRNWSQSAVVRIAVRNLALIAMW
jgi:hypothetical protein